MNDIEKDLFKLCEADVNVPQALEMIISLADGFGGDATDFAEYLKAEFLNK